jgi:hypothetical protein
VKRLALLLALAGSVLAFGASPAGATDECDGLMVCVPVAGPWVVVPVGHSVPRPQVEWQLSCPRSYVVGGTDAELTVPAIDVGFAGTLGSPVSPGITTSRAIVFVATYVGGRVRGATPPSFRPHIGCMPASGGGRVLTSYHAVKPGKPTVRRVFAIRVRPGAQTVSKQCAASELLTGATHATGFYTRDAPRASLAASVRVTQRIRGAQVRLGITAGPEVLGARAEVQLSLVCAGGK